MMDSARYDALRAEVNGSLSRIAREDWDGIPEPLRGAMEYALNGGGKRLRPVLLLAAHELIAPYGKDAMLFACALEMIHTYSLIHDDLPAMDDDTLRRGRPTCHVVYGEGMAVLAGDGLLSLAFEMMLSSPHARAKEAAYQIAREAGVRGMVAGQCLDLSGEGKEPTPELVSAIHRKKTACLLTAPMEAGLTLAGADGTQLAAGREFGQKLGLAFQIRDDLLDLTGDEKTLGKHIGKDTAEGKLTWPALYGQEQSVRDMRRLTEEACAALAGTFGGGAAFLCGLAGEMADRAF